VSLIAGAALAGVAAAVLAVTFIINGSGGNQPGSAGCASTAAPSATATPAAGLVLVLVYLDGGQASPALLCDIGRTAGVWRVTPLSQAKAQELPSTLRVYNGQVSPMLVVQATDAAAARQLVHNLTAHPGVRGVRATI
jgi:hypothetical protein